MSHENMARIGLPSVREQIEATFTPWEKNPMRLARLLRFLQVIGEYPKDVPAFLEAPEDFTEQYELMVTFEHPSPAAACKLSREQKA